MKDNAFRLADSPKTLFTIIAAIILPGHHVSRENAQRAAKTNASLLHRPRVLCLVPFELHGRAYAVSGFMSRSPTA
jgi:hypothetical protein